MSMACVVSCHVMQCDVMVMSCTTLPENRSILGNLRNLPNLGGKIRKIRKILENRPRFSERSSPDSRESSPILEDSEE